MTNGERMRVQVLNAITNAQYDENLFHLTPSDRYYNKILEGVKVVVKGLPPVEKKAHGR